MATTQANIAQQDRVYELVVGDFSTGDGVLITELQIQFSASISADNKKSNNSASVQIYNLSRRTLALLESEFLTCSLKAGYRQIGLHEILSGNVVEVSTTKSGPDLVTTLHLGEAYSQLNHKRVKSTVAPGKTKVEIIEEIRRQMPGIVKGSYVGAKLNELVPFGYSLNGSPRQMLDRFTKANRMEWRITNNALHISEENGLVDNNTEDAPIISKTSGLIDIPYFSSTESDKLDSDKTRKTGVTFKALLNPTVKVGRIVKLESEVMPSLNGFYRVNDISYTGDYRGNDWYMECACAKVTGVQLSAPLQEAIV